MLLLASSSSSSSLSSLLSSIIVVIFFFCILHHPYHPHPLQCCVLSLLLPSFLDADDSFFFFTTIRLVCLVSNVFRFCFSFFLVYYYCCYYHYIILHNTFLVATIIIICVDCDLFWFCFKGSSVFVKFTACWRLLNRQGIPYGTTYYLGSSRWGVVYGKRNKIQYTQYYSMVVSGCSGFALAGMDGGTFSSFLLFFSVKQEIHRVKIL